MSRITFATGGPDWNVADGALRISARIEDSVGETRDETLYFTVPAGFFAHPDSVGAALSTLCGRSFGTVAFDFPLSGHAKRTIEAAYGIQLETRGTPAEPRQPGTATLLNFSGGFDSMAALALTGEGEVTLLSMDFGGAFAREEEYFRTFNTVVCKTDLRQKGFHRNDWRFMGVGSLLLSDMLSLGTVGFGTILEASPWNLRPRAGLNSPALEGPFGALGIEQTSWIRGLTEFGTAMVMLAFRASDVVPSLASLASKGTEKHLRKHLLLEVAAERLGVAMPPVGDRVSAREKATFGTAFTVDFLAPYFAQRFGRDYLSTFLAGFPEDDDTRELLASDLGFYLKYNPNFVAHIPLTLRNRVLDRMHAAGLYPYTEADFESFAKVRRYMSRRYAIPA